MQQLSLVAVYSIINQFSEFSILQLERGGCNLQITTIRRYGGNTTRSRIPIGSFYGHTFILPWQRDANVPPTVLTGPGPVDSEDSATLPDQSVILSQLNIYTSLLEEVQCRYSLASKNLITLLSAVDIGGGGQAHYSQYFLKRGKRTDEDNRIYQTYHECCQLQVLYIIM